MGKDGSGEQEPVQALQVVAVIAMPSRERATRRGAWAKKAEAEAEAETEVGVREVQGEEEEVCGGDWQGDFGEYVLGAARVSWEAGNREGHGTG